MLTNIEYELKLETEALGKAGSRSGGNVTVKESEYSLDEEEFKEMSKKMKAVAEKQHEERMKEKKNGT